jgi:hypothetical protein
VTPSAHNLSVHERRVEARRLSIVLILALLKIRETIYRSEAGLGNSPRPISNTR